MNTAPIYKLHIKTYMFSVVTHRSRLSWSSCSPVGGLRGGNGSGTAKTQRTRGSWCWCPDEASNSNHQRSWPSLIAASSWFLPLLPAHNPPQPRNGLPIHHCRRRRERRRAGNISIAGGPIQWARIKQCHNSKWETLLDSDDLHLSLSCVSSIGLL